MRAPFRRPRCGGQRADSRLPFARSDHALLRTRPVDREGQGSHGRPGFRGREVKYVEDMVEQLDAIEDDTDGMQVKLRRALREIEGQMNPVDVMFLYDIIGWVGELADLSERVGSRLELMLAG